MKNNIKIILAIFGSLALVAVVVMIVLSDPALNKTSTSAFKKDDPHRPIVILSLNKIDWGEISLRDIKESEVELKNDGVSSLEITKLSTSCDCTSVRLFYNGTETKEYSMDMEGMRQALNDKISIAPKTSAKLKVIYRPFVMPVDGAVTRQVFIETNDPVNPKLEIKASAVVKQ